MLFETGEKPLFLDVSSTNIDTLVPSLYQSKPAAQKYFDSCLNHFREMSVTKAEALYTTNISHSEQKIFIYESPLF
jgi:hypothetical protein